MEERRHGPSQRPTRYRRAGRRRYGAPTLLGQGPARIPTGGKIRAGIKVLTKKAAGEPKAKAIYDQGVAAGQSFEQIERAIAEALPNLKTPLVPRNVPWFTVRAQDFPNPEIAREILDAYGEDRGEGRRLYRFPVVFPSDYWQTVMPHELAAWGAHEKHYWSQYSADGRVRHCMCHAPVPVDETGRRTIRLFGGRKTMIREDNGGLCEPEACREYQQRQCNLTGRFLFFIPGIRSISAFELHTNSFYAMNAAIQKFETVGFLRGGRISGFLDRQRTPFYLTKKTDGGGPHRRAGQGRARAAVDHRPGGAGGCDGLAARQRRHRDDPGAGATGDAGASGQSGSSQCRIVAGRMPPTCRRRRPWPMQRPPRSRRCATAVPASSN
jgi:hypothetical protein